MYIHEMNPFHPISQALSSKGPSQDGLDLFSKNKYHLPQQLLSVLAWGQLRALYVGEDDVLRARQESLAW